MRKRRRNAENDSFLKERLAMVENQIKRRGVKDERVLTAMEKVPRHLFVPENLRACAYQDEPLPIGEGQTISQPYIVAYMTEILNLIGQERVLEVGTGSGYQTAILAEIVHQVFTVELVASLSLRAQSVLEQLGYKNIDFRVGDGTYGWPEQAPFQAILVTAAARKIPPNLESQLADGGRMIIPVGEDFQELVLVTMKDGRLNRQNLLPVRFVPLVTCH